MATTSRPISELVNGIRDTTGAVVPSGKVRFYQPGTLTTQTVYSDALCTLGITQPVTLNAGGQATVFTLEPVRMIAKDSTETTTYYDDIPNLNRHDAVYITSSGINGGAETTLETVLSTATTSLGAGFQYKESSGATARNWVDVIGDAWVSVKDFGAAGNGTTDDTAAIQAAYDRIEARGGGWVYWPDGTYKITSAITIDAAGVSTRGAGRGIAIVKNFGTVTDTFLVNLGSAVDSKIVFEDISITADTTSSGAGIIFVNGDKPTVRRVTVGLHRTGISTAAVTSAHLQDVFIDTVTSNAADVGLNLGARSRANNCEVVAGADFGAGIQVNGADVRIIDCYVTNFVAGIHVVSGARAHIRGCHVVGSATTGIHTAAGSASVNDCYVVGTTVTGYNIADGQTTVTGCFADTCTTGFVVGAGGACSIDRCQALTCTTGFSILAGTSTGTWLTNSRGSANTTDLLVAAATAKVFITGNNFPVETYTSGTSSALGSPLRIRFNSTSSVTATETFTPNIASDNGLGVGQVNVISYVLNSASGTTTIGAHNAAKLVAGDVLWFVFTKQNAGNQTVAWNAQYQDIDGTAVSITTVNSATSNAFVFVWDGANWRMIHALLPTGWTT